MKHLSLVVWPVLLLAILMQPTHGVEAQEVRAGEGSTMGSGHLRGTVTDRITGHPIADVGVRLHFAEGGSLLRMTDNAGRFLFSSISPGLHELEFIRIGYGEVRDSLRVEPMSETQVDAGLAPDAIELDPLVVATTRRSRLESNGFYERQRVRSGSFITRDDIEDRRPAYLSDLLRTVPSIRTVQGRSGEGAAILGRGGCQPVYYLDGVRLVGTPSLDYTIPPNDLEGVEVYPASSTPPQFQGNRCGSIVMWSRQPVPGTAEGNFWFRLLIGTLFATGAYLLTR